MEPKHVCLGLVPISRGTGHNIRISTEQKVNGFFHEEQKYFICHDTCSSMNSAFGIAIEDDYERNDLMFSNFPFLSSHHRKHKIMTKRY